MSSTNQKKMPFARVTFHEGIPVYHAQVVERLPRTSDGHLQITFKCSCGHAHYHGSHIDDADKPQHRAAHCPEGKPIKGYYFQFSKAQADAAMRGVA